MFRALTPMLRAFWPVALLFASKVMGADRASQNAVQAADDAFGISVGHESIGLYSSTDVRGFSAIDTGNVRFEGLYVDAVNLPSQRLLDSTSIRVGIAAQGFLFPAPTGVVDYTLHRPGDKLKASGYTHVDTYGAYSFEFDGEAPLVRDKLGSVWAARSRATVIITMVLIPAAQPVSCFVGGRRQASNFFRCSAMPTTPHFWERQSTSLAATTLRHTSRAGNSTVRIGRATGPPTSTMEPLLTGHSAAVDAPRWRALFRRRRPYRLHQSLSQPDAAGSSRSDDHRRSRFNQLFAQRRG